MTNAIRFAIAALVLLVSACTPTQPASAGPAIWRLADEDSEIWLFGSVHVLPPKLKWRSAKIDQAFKSADTLYFETPVDATGQKEITAVVMRYGYNAPGVTLTEKLTNDDRARFLRLCRKLNVDPVTMERARPWLAATQLSVAQVIKQGQAMDSGVEQVLEREAKAQNKKRAYFETSEEQIRLLADLPPKVEMQYFTVTLRQIEEEDEDIDTLDDAWARGDTKALEKELTSELEEIGPEVYAAVIRDRNERWVKKIDAMMKGSGKIFITVGAAHLIGDDGVPALLRKKGYVVEGP